MDKDNKLRFIDELVDQLKNDLVDRLERMPEEWDGLEIRCLAAERLQEAVRPMPMARKRRYRNVVATRNL